jgi:two-component system phosphate regulon sensor histidine kinase PhoR
LDESNTSAIKETVDLYSLVEDVMLSLKDSADKRNIEISLNGEHAVVQGVRRVLNELIFNLCDNAIKYNKDGGKVDISVKNTDGTISLSVADTGIGIAKEEQERIFERFYRVDKSHSKQIGGTGLGLSIVKHAARLHNARISLESELDKGTKITIKF